MLSRAKNCSVMRKEEFLFDRDNDEKE